MQVDEKLSTGERHSAARDPAVWVAARLDPDLCKNETARFR